MSHSRVSLMGLDFDAMTEEETVDSILSGTEQGRGGWLVTPNLEYLRAYQVVDEVQREFDAAELVVPDGTPLLWASRIKHTPLPGRVAGSDLIWSLSAGAARRGASVFLLGGSPGTAERAADRLCEHCPGLEVRGVLSPGFDAQRNGADLAATARKVAACRPDIVYIGLPLEKHIAMARRLRQLMPDSWLIGVGVSFSFVSGEIARAPEWVQRAGLEWLHRLLHEPRRLFRRYVVHGFPFAGRLLAYSLLARAMSAVTMRPDTVVPRSRR